MTTKVDQAIANAIDIERYKEGHIKKVMPLLNNLNKDISNILLRLKLDNPRDVNEKLRRVDQLIDSALTKIETMCKKEYALLVQHVIQVEQNTILKALVEEEKEETFAIAPILASLILGKSFTALMSDMRRSTKNRVRVSVRTGITDNLPLTAIVNSVRGTRARRFRDGTFNTTLNHMDAITRTAIQTFSNKAKQRVWLKKVPESARQYIWLSVLDDRTSVICRGRSNNIYEVGKGPLPPAHYRCFDKDTDVLTRDGWKNWKDVDGSEEFLSVDLETQDAEYVKAVRIIKYHYKGDMDSYRNNNVDILTTPNHTHVVKHRVKTKGRKDAGYWKLENGEDLTKSDYNFLATIPDWKGSPEETLTYCNTKISSLNFMKFLGIYLSEGSIVKNYFRKGDQKQIYKISIHQEKYYAEFLEILTQCFGEDKVTGHRNSGKIYIYQLCDEIATMLKGLGHSHEKFLPEKFKGYNQEHCEAFLQYFALGDGSFQKSNSLGGYKPTVMRLHHTSSKSLADDISELVLKIGKRPSFTLSPPKESVHKNGTYMSNHYMWCVRECTGQSHSRDKMAFEKVSYDDFVYDVELEKWHTLIVRRKGRVFVSGNCRSVTSLYEKGDSVPEGYSEWLRKQPREVIDDILGDTKAKMFLAGNLPLNKFTVASGRELTIEELQKRT